MSVTANFTVITTPRFKIRIWRSDWIYHVSAEEEVAANLSLSFELTLVEEEVKGDHIQKLSSLSDPVNSVLCHLMNILVNDLKLYYNPVR